MGVSKRIAAALESASWIRRMFEEGAELKARLGADRVFDFTLGNPDLEPPAAVQEALRAAVEDQSAGRHGYMPNAGLLATRQAVAAYLSQLHGLEVAAEDVVMTCGAAGALNVILKAILDPGDEVIIFAPFFPEYLFYVANHGGTVRIVDTDARFQPDPGQVAAALSNRTRAVLLNSPNNPTGQIYPAATLEALGEILTAASSRFGRPVYLINDEPYRQLVYDGLQVPSVFQIYPDSLVATSFSKDLSLPGERIGYLAINPRSSQREELRQGCILANRILGYVNAPALWQRVIARTVGLSVDLTPYRHRRQLLGNILANAGYDFLWPQGAFYFFPRAPLPDDTAFVQLLKEENILAVPGRGFGRPGYFRLAFCVPEITIVNAAPGFARAWQRARELAAPRS